MGYGEFAVIGWMITFLCIGFFILGMAGGYGKPDDKSLIEETQFWGYLSLGATGVLLVIWLWLF